VPWITSLDAELAGQDGLTGGNFATFPISRAARYLRHAFGLAGGDAGLAQLDPQAIRARTFEALRRLLVAMAARRPLVMLVEDLHWIDQTSQDFLAELADELPSVPILLLVTYRPGYSPPWIGNSFTSQLALRADRLHAEA